MDIILLVINVLLMEFIPQIVFYMMNKVAVMHAKLDIIFKIRLVDSKEKKQ